MLILWCPGLAGQAAAPAFDSSKAWEHLRQQVAIGPRPSGSAANVKNRDYIKAQMAAFGIKTTEQPFDGATPNGPVKMVNIIATSTIGSIAGVNTLGDLILGPALYGQEGVIAGAIVVALLALTFELILAGLQRLLTPRGLVLQRAAARASA